MDGDTAQCKYCARIGTRGFYVVGGKPEGPYEWACANHPACERRQERLQRINDAYDARRERR